MAVKNLSKTDEFVVIDETGNCFLIIQYTEMLHPVEGGGRELVPGRQRFVTAANEVVHSNRDGTFLIAGTTSVLRRVN